jgi:glycosyltransferase involved in cell wall biosynthesis
MSRPIRILELRSVRGTGGGPEKTILLGARPRPGSGCLVTVCYIRDSRDTEFEVAARVQLHPEVDYVEIAERHSLDFRIWPALRRLIRQRRIDIVHAHDYKTDLLALLLGRSSSVVPMATAHAWVGETRRERFLYHPGDKLILSRFPRVVAVSKDIRAELVRYGAVPERVTLLANGIDHCVFKRDRSREALIRARLGIAPGAFVIGAVGRLDPEKRFDVLMRAVGRLGISDTQVVVVIVGDGGERVKLRTLANELGIAPRCQMLGFRTDIADLHHAFDVFVQASIREGTPNAVLEAMALETPVIATRAGGTAELISDRVHGLLVPTDDVAAFVTAIETVRRDYESCKQRAALARMRVEQELSFDERTRRLEEIYESLMAPSPRVPTLAESCS